MYYTSIITSSFYLIFNLQLSIYTLVYTLMVVAFILYMEHIFGHRKIIHCITMVIIVHSSHGTVEMYTWCKKVCKKKGINRSRTCTDWPILEGVLAWMFQCSIVKIKILPWIYFKKPVQLLLFRNEISTMQSLVRQATLTFMWCLVYIRQKSSVR